MRDVLRLLGGPRRRALLLLAGAASLLLLLVSSAFRPALDVRLWRCRPRRSVCFVKTHKCASSSVQNVLLRYGESHGLRFVLPPRTNYLGHPRPFHRSMAAPSGRPPFDVLAHHARFRESEMRAVLRPGAAFVTIVREPAALFESLYSYYDLQAKTRLSLEQLGNKSLSGQRLRRLARSRGKLGFNQMSFDLGLEPAHFGNASAVRHFVERLDATFDLVMVAERINESLVLLRHLLCWDVDDVVVFRHNARQSGYRRRLSDDLAEQLRSLNAADVQLYEHFWRRLEERVEAFGRQRMARELRRLEERTRHWYDRCVRETRPPDKKRPPGHKFWMSSKILKCGLLYLVEFWLGTKASVSATVSGPLYTTPQPFKGASCIRLCLPTFKMAFQKRCES
ncbi:galactosylceramide sulfotransferase-like isoform X1 [Amblyomma americanum]